MIALQHDNVRFNNKNDELITGYYTKIFRIKIFIGETLSDDELIKQIKTHKIKSKKLIYKLFADLSLDTILEVFGYDLSKILKFLFESDCLQQFEKESLAFELLNKFREKEQYKELLKLIVKNNQNPLWLMYLNPKIHNEIVIGCFKTYIDALDSDMIKYLLNANFQQQREENGVLEQENNNARREFAESKNKFIYECRYLVRRRDYLKTRENFDVKGIICELDKYDKKLPFGSLTIRENDDLETRLKKTKERFKQGLDIDFKEAIYLLGMYFEGNLNLDTISMQAITRSIVTEMLKKLKITNNGTYFFDEKKIKKYGSSYKGCIEIGLVAIRKFLNVNLPLKERLLLFNIFFHEIKHALIRQDSINGIWTPEAYEILKENIASRSDIEFYDKNYALYLEELLAEISGLDMMQKFIQEFFPALLTLIQDQIIEELKAIQQIRRKQNNYDRTLLLFGQIKLRFNTMFDLLVRYNPGVIASFPILNLEYTESGEVRTAEDILSARTDKNKKLIDEIIKRRYPEFFARRRRR